MLTMSESFRGSYHGCLDPRTVKDTVGEEYVLKKPLCFMVGRNQKTDIREQGEDALYPL